MEFLFLLIFISAYQKNKNNLIELTIENKIKCASKTTSGYGYQRATNITKTTCIYKTNLGYVFLDDYDQMDLKPKSKIQYLPYHIYSNQSKTYKALFDSYGFN